MSKYCVYLHINKHNGKKYVGITSTSPIKRWANGGGYKTQPLFYRAIMKYRWANFEHEVLYENLTAEEAAKREVYLIELFNSDIPVCGYNSTSGGYAGVSPSEEVRDKIRAARIGKRHTAETRKKMSESKAGRVLTAEQRKAISDRQRGKTMSEETRTKISEAKRGANHPLFGKKRPRELVNRIAKMSCKKVVKKTLAGEVVSEYESVKQAAASVPCSVASISNCCNGKIKSFAGFAWEFVDVCKAAQ